MADLKEINAAITELERKETNYPNCNRLAVLYTVRDHIQPEERTTTEMPGRAADIPSSEFVEIASSKNIMDVLTILNEYMDVMSILYPTTYKAIINKLLAL